MNIREQISNISNLSRVMPSEVEQIAATRKAVGTLPQVRRNCTAKLQFGGKSKASPCTIDGVEYASLAAAAKAHNTSTSRVFKRCRSADSRFVCWVQHGVPKPPPKTKHRAVIVHGVEYPSLRAAGDEIGCAASTVKDRCERQVEGWRWV